MTARIFRARFKIPLRILAFVFLEDNSASTRPKP